MTMEVYMRKSRIHTQIHGYRARAVALVVAILVATAVAVPAFDDFAPDAADVEIEREELVQFAEALQAVEQIRTDAQEEMQGVIAQSDLETERFNEIHASRVDPNAPDVEVSEGEAGEYELVVEFLIEIEEGAQAHMAEIVLDHGLTVEQFNTIAVAIQSDPELWEEFSEVVQELQG